MTRHRVEMPDYTAAETLVKTWREQIRPLRENVAKSRALLLNQIEKTGGGPFDQHYGSPEDSPAQVDPSENGNLHRESQDPVKSPGDQPSEAKQKDLLPITVGGVGSFLVRRTPEILEAVDADKQADTALQEFLKSTDQQFRAEQAKALLELMTSMGEQGWFFADMFRRVYENGAYNDLCIFVETGTAAVERDTPCAHKRISLDELDAIEDRMWEETEQHLVSLAHIQGITDEQINEVKLAAINEIPVEALTEFLSLQGQEGWRFVALAQQSFVFVRNLR